VRVSEESMSSRETMKSVNFMMSSRSVNLTPLTDRRLCSSERVISKGLVGR